MLKLLVQIHVWKWQKKKKIMIWARCGLLQIYRFFLSTALGTTSPGAVLGSSHHQGVLCGFH